MLIGVIADTHDKLETIDLAMRYFREQRVRLVIHCGDWKSVATAEYFAEQAAGHALPVRGVLGNNDVDVDGFLNLSANAPGDFVLYETVYTRPLADGTYLAAHHGHHKPTVRKLSADPDCRILLRGHSHKPLVKSDDGRLLVNPGSTAFAIPRNRNWRPSVALVDTLEKTARIQYLA